MTAQHTPGPWFTWRSGVYSGTPKVKTKTMLSGYGRQICDMDEDMGRTAKANARLIAAAPDLLVLLKEIGKANSAQVAPVYSELARAAIAKATGGAA